MSSFDFCEFCDSYIRYRVCECSKAVEQRNREARELEAEYLAAHATLQRLECPLFQLYDSDKWHKERAIRLAEWAEKLERNRK